MVKGFCVRSKEVWHATHGRVKQCVAHFKNLEESILRASIIKIL